MNEQIDATMRDIEGLQNQIHDYQRQLILDNDSHAVQRAASILISPTPEDTPDREKMLEQKVCLYYFVYSVDLWLLNVVLIYERLRTCSDKDAALSRSL